MRKLTGLLILLFLLSGCFESSLVMGPAVGGAQGKLTQSSVSTAFSYGIKHKTGKYPLQHILKQKKEKAVKTVSLVEEKVLTTTNKTKHNLVKEPEVKLVQVIKEPEVKLVQVIKEPEVKSVQVIKEPEVKLVQVNYKTIKAKITKLKIRTISEKIFVHEPRFSYSAR